MPKISVVVPVYNVEAFLDACLASIAAQTCKDFEVVLMDDGSTDQSGAICDAFVQAHDNASVVHQKNAGLSVARNEGVKHAKGEYIVFVDSDDVLSEDHLEYLYSLIEKYNADVAAAGRVSFEDGQQPKVKDVPVKECCVDTKGAIRDYSRNLIEVYAFAKMYKRHLVERNPYPAGKIFEDMATTHRILADASCVAYSNKVIYYRRQRAGSLTHLHVDEKQYYGITAAKDYLAFVQEHFPESSEDAKLRCAMKILNITYRMVLGKTEFELFRRARGDVKPLVGSVLKNKRARMSQKAGVLGLYLGFVPYYLLCRVQRLTNRTY